MKRTIFGFTAAALLATGSASAAPLTSDDFSYSDGNITDNAAWTAHSGSGSNPVQVASGEAVLTHGSSSREDVFTSFAAQGTGGGAVVYAAFNFSVDDDGGPVSGTDNEYFAHFSTGGTSDFVARVDIAAAQATGDFTVGIATFSSTADTLWATDLAFDTEYLAVIKYDIDADQATLWIDPVSELSTSILGADGTAPVDISAFALRQSNSTADETIRVDNLVVATTFAEVVPEPGSLALLGLGGLLIARRRRG